MNHSPVGNPSVLNLEGQTPPLRWEEVFPTPMRAIELEIGFGKGRFLRREAERRPEVGFFGVERAGKWFALAAKRIASDGNPNLRVARSDAFDFLARWVPVGSLAAVYILFPDPWPKKRHAKRRLLTPALYDLTARGLAPDGKMTIATDMTWYFEEALADLSGQPAFDKIATSRADEEEILTNYAIKYAKEGRALHLARFKRNRSSAPPLPPPPSRRRRAASSAPLPAREGGP